MNIPKVDRLKERPRLGQPQRGIVVTKIVAGTTDADKLKTIPISTTAPSEGQVLTAEGGTWIPKTPTSSGGIGTFAHGVINASGDTHSVLYAPDTSPRVDMTGVNTTRIYGGQSPGAGRIQLESPIMPNTVGTVGGWLVMEDGSVVSALDQSVAANAATWWIYAKPRIHGNGLRFSQEPLAGDPNLQILPVSVGSLSDATVTVRPDTTNIGLGIYGASDSSVAAALYARQRIELGPGGGAARDTNIIRDAPGRLRIDSALFINTASNDNSILALLGPTTMSPAGTTYSYSSNNVTTTLGKAMTASILLFSTLGTISAAGFAIGSVVGFNFAPTVSSTVANSTVTNFFDASFGGNASSGGATVLTVTNIAAVRVIGPTIGANTVVTNNHRGIHITNPTLTGTVSGSRIAIDIDAQTHASAIGVRVALCGTYALQLSDTGGTAAGGITWGTDVQAYRAAAGILVLPQKVGIGSADAGSILNISPPTGVSPSNFMRLAGTRNATAVDQTLNIALWTSPSLDAAGFYGQKLYYNNVILSAANSSAITGDSGTATATTATVITDSGKSWTAGQWTGGVIQIAGQNRTILGNTATTITVGKAFDPTPGLVAYTLIAASHDEASFIRIVPSIGAAAMVGYMAGLYFKHSSNSIGSQAGEIVAIDVGDLDDTVTVHQEIVGLRVGNRGGRDTPLFGASLSPPTVGYPIYINAHVSDSVYSVSRNPWSFGFLTAPSAIVDIGASATTRASLRIRGGTAPTTPNEGEIWHDSTQKVAQGFWAGVKQSLEGVLFTQTSTVTVGPSSTTETSLLGTLVGTKTIPANFWTIGKTLRLRAWGYATTTNVINFTIRVRLGGVAGTLLLFTNSIVPVNGAANKPWNFEADITCRTTGATGTVMSQGMFTLADLTTVDVSNNPTATPLGSDWALVKTATVTVDTTAAKDMELTAQYSSSDATDSIKCSNATLEVLN